MNRFWKAVILTWLFAGTMDLTAAYISQWIKSGKFADKMLYYIAGGILGLDTSLQGGNRVAFLGLCIHYTIAFSATLFFFWVFPKIKILSFDKYVIGAFYGIFVNIVVGRVINWFTPLPDTPFVFANVVVAWFILVLCLGIPIAHNTYRFYDVKPFKFRKE
jgi:predicted permease